MLRPFGNRPPLVAALHAALGDARRRLAARDAAIVDEQIAVAEIAAPTGDESERGAWIEQRFRQASLTDVHVDGAGNIIGRRPGTTDSEPVVICAHLDTVFPRDTTLTVQRAGHRLVGPGINDNGRGLAVMLALAAEIDGQRLATVRPIEFVATTGEEGAGDLRGAKHYFDSRGRDAAAAIAIDGAGDERVIHRALGSRRFRVRYDGPGGHSWTAFGAPNPVHAAAAAVAALAAIPLPTTPRTALTVGRIGGGLSVNSIPGEAWFDLDIRSASAAQLDALTDRLMRATTESATHENAHRAAGTDALTVRVTRIGDRPCGETPAEHPLVRAAVETTELIGRRADLTLASTDANVPISHGIPAIAIGAGGRGGDAHTPNEWYENTDGSIGIGRALTIVVSAAQLAAD
jgi:tripeptide aminopeptidase